MLRSLVGSEMCIRDRFERAVDYFRNPDNEGDKFPDGSEPEAVHLAITLAQSGLLELTCADASGANNSSACLNLLQPVDKAQLDKSHVSIDYCSLLYQYALRYLSTKTPELALKYLALIPNSHREVRIECMVELAKETRDYNRLFLTSQETITANSDLPLLNQLMNWQNCPADAKKVTSLAARDAYDRDFWEQAIDLYLASEMPGAAVETVCRELEREYASELGGHRNHILLERVKRLLEDTNMTTKGPEVHSLQKLYAVSAFFEAYAQGMQGCRERDALPRRNAEALTEYANPAEQKRTQIERAFATALEYLQGHSQHMGIVRPRLIPIIGPDNLQAVSERIVDECVLSYQNEARTGVQSAIRSMLAPVCDILNWLLENEEQYGTKSEHVRDNNKKEIIRNCNQLKMFAHKIHNIVPLSQDVAKQVSSLRLE
eukprot:TRINITY_DN24292_c0_g1_i1.p1 TRINITY_DN24292_c0_g1~~TRINITY_DN24292_c0_g1_i1.p1  ORF type:complete len:433 (+),score=98.90 TRINITY_DN24292_c0_g1_i1:65-1363(+)